MGNSTRSTSVAGFTLIEMAVVTAILIALMTVGVSLVHSTGPQSRRAATDMLTGLIEQARTHAITSRSYVILAIAEPGDLPSDDNQCRIGMFRVDEWPDTPAGAAVTVNATLMSRWKTLNSGVVLLPEKVDGLENPMGGDQSTITYTGGGSSQSVNVHMMAFNPRGGLHYPTGSSPIALRIAEGGYRNGRASANKRADQADVSENRLKIFRVTARPFRIDG